MFWHFFIYTSLFISPFLYSSIIENGTFFENSYAVKIGEFEANKNITKLKYIFQDKDIFVCQKGKRNLIYLVNLIDKTEAKASWKESRRLVKDSFILSINRVPIICDNSFMIGEEEEPPQIDISQNLEPIIEIPVEDNITKIELPDIVEDNITNIELPDIVEDNITNIELPDVVEEVKEDIVDFNHTISLKEAILKALNKSHKILAQREKIIQAKRKIDEKIAAYKPNVVLYGTAGGAYTKDEKIPEDKYLKGDIQLSITENLYAGGKHQNDIQKERHNLLVAVYKFRSKVEEETQKVIESYFDILFERRAIKANEKNMKNLERILNIITIKEKEGDATKGDLNYISSNIENSKSQFIKAQSKYQNAIAYYEYFVGDIEQNQPREQNISQPIKSQDEAIETLYKNNSKVQIAEAKLEAQKSDLQSRRASFRPTVDFIVTAKDTQTGALNEPQNDKASAILSLNYNLYSGGKDEAKFLGSKSKIAQLQYSLKDTKEGSKYNIIQIYQDIESSKDSLLHIKKEVAANNEVVKSYWLKFKYGKQDLQTLLLAQRALNSSQISEIKEEKSYILGIFKLLSEAGTMLEYLEIEDFVNPDKIIQKK